MLLEQVKAVYLKLLKTAEMMAAVYEHHLSFVH